MNRRRKYSAGLCLLLLLLLLTGMQVFAQEAEIAAMLRYKFDRYVSRVSWEDVYVHTDMQEYVAGEIIWMKVYAVDRKSARPSMLSRIAYVELLNADNRPVVQQRILLGAGCGVGQISLPDTLSSGTYLLRAYTGWMRNFLPDHCFMREIQIHNALDPLAKQTKTVFPPQPQSTSNPASGFALKVALHQHEGTVVWVVTQKPVRQKSPEVFLCVLYHGQIQSLKGHTLTADTSRILLPAGSLKTGTNQLTLFSAEGKPVAETMILLRERKEEGKRNKEEFTEVGLRQKVTIPFAEIAMDLPDNLQYSVSVAPAQVSPCEGLEDYLVLGSEFGIQRRLSDAIPQGDTVVLALKSRWINWEAIMADRLPELPYPAETESHFLSGRVMAGDQPFPAGQFVLLNIPGKEAQFRYAVTGSKGNFMFTLPVDEEIRDLMILPDDVQNNPKIAFESSFSGLFPRWYAVDTLRRLAPFAAKLCVNYQVSSIYRIAPIGDQLPPVSISPKPQRFYGKPDIELRMDEYIQLPVMEEVFHELLPNVTLKKKKTDVSVEITSRDVTGLVVNTPAMMVDGVMVKDPGVIVDIDPELVEKIDVVKEKYVTGAYRFPGIVNVITKSGDFSVVSQPTYMTRIPYRVIDPVNAFPQPDYSTPEKMASRVPDYRNTLLWEPGNSASQPGKHDVTFTTSDNPGDYLLRLEGINPDGRIVSVSRRIRVPATPSRSF